MKDPKRSAKGSCRRSFLKKAGAALAFLHVVPASVLGRPRHRAPSDKLGVVCIGVGGRGRASVNACRGENILALCDVDDRRAAGTYKGFPAAKKYKDFRIMLDELDRQIDAVTVGTPDHTHAVATMDAIRRGKHVYCEKPLAHTVYEVRALMAAARKHKVVTQLGNQGHSSNDIRRFCEWIWDGAIGEVKEIHACCDAFRSVYCQIDKLPLVSKHYDVPEGLDYDLWVGPAPFIHYTPLWVPWNWRGWVRFGTGCIGDWVCHVVDPSFWALDLGAPVTIKAEVTGYDPVKHAECYPPGAKVTFEFPAKGKRGPVKLIWFDGVMRPPRPKELEKGRRIPGTGAIVYGTNGVIMHGSHGAGGVRIIPQERMRAYKEPPQKIPRVRGGHHRDWLDAIKEGRKAGSDIAEYGGPLTQIALLGMIAIRFPGITLKWDNKKMRFTNHEEANKYVNPPYRKGWTL